MAISDDQFENLFQDYLFNIFNTWLLKKIYKQNFLKEGKCCIPEQSDCFTGKSKILKHGFSVH